MLWKCLYGNNTRALSHVELEGFLFSLIVVLVLDKHTVFNLVDGLV
jgi:hypothetical protein